MFKKMVIQLGFDFAIQFGLFRQLPNRIRVLMYHGVDDIHFKLDDFERQLKFFSKNFTTYWAKELPDLLSVDLSNFKKPPLILTFDDGLQNNALFVAPLIEKYQLKATFFLVSDLLSGQEMLWNHEALCRLMLVTDPVKLKKMGIDGGESNKQALIKEVVEKQKQRKLADRQAWMDKLRDFDASPVFTSEMLQSYAIMSVAEAKKLPGCIEIGSHGVTHQPLHTVPINQQTEELIQSKEKLNRLFQKPIETFCFPNGYYTNQVIPEVKKYYKASFSTREGFAKTAHLAHRIPASSDFYRLLLRLIRPTA
jgi:peptidoglycan/xylan/chitin deacetylase (PgdA/CDA1 family)